MYKQACVANWKYLARTKIQNLFRKSGVFHRIWQISGPAGSWEIIGLRRHSGISRRNRVRWQVCVQNRYCEREIGIPCTEPSAKYRGAWYFGIPLHHYHLEKRIWVPWYKFHCFSLSISWSDYSHLYLNKCPIISSWTYLVRSNCMMLAWSW
jgi:homogentisate 1,2-dioxygenase